MQAPDTGWTASAHLRAIGWGLRAHLVEIRLKQLIAALEAHYNPNQPRVPAGSGRQSGRWTDGDGGTQIAQSAPPEEESGEEGELEEPTPGEAARLAVARATADEAIRKVRELDPNWKPSPSLSETVEGQISAADAEAAEAQARLDELARVGIGPGPYAGDSIPARGPGRNFTPAEREQINQIGAETGCHTCGSPSPNTTSGNFVPDHQLPSALNNVGRSQRLYPQCLGCSRTQGGVVSNFPKRGK